MSISEQVIVVPQFVIIPREVIEVKVDDIFRSSVVLHDGKGSKVPTELMFASCNSITYYIMY